MLRVALLSLLTIAGVSVSQKANAEDVITVAGGCFWCVEADFERVPGVIEAVSGFTGGDVQNPSYKDVVSGGTGHIEAVQIRFDPAQVSRRELFDLFFRSVDPTDANGQFCDRGYSYTTAIFAGSLEERADAQAAKANAQSELGQTIVTPINDASAFYPADAYHQDYYKQRDLILTRFGPKRKSEAYKAYRNACGRDARVVELWGTNAPFAKK